ncbi:MAG: helix-turn-helix domain-containing protein [Pseudomonadota bacterium]
MSETALMESKAADKSKVEPKKRKNGTYATIGELLAARREELGHDLAEVSERTRLRERHLAAIEAMDIAALPGRTYALGFLKTYADFLGLDPEACAAKFKEQAGLAKPEQPSREDFAKTNTVLTEKKSAPVFLILVIIALMGWGLWQITRPVGEADVSNLPWPPQRAAEPTPDPEASQFAASSVLTRLTQSDPGAAAPDAAASDDVAAAPVENGVPAPVETPPAPTPDAERVIDLTGDGRVQVVVGQPTAEDETAAAAPEPEPANEAESGSAEEPVEGVAAPETPAVGADDVEADEAAASEDEAQETPDALAEGRTIPALPQGRNRGASPGDSRLAVRALIPGYLEVRNSNGVVVLSEQLATGDIFYAPDEPGLTFTVVNAGGFDILVDGAYGGRLGRPGEVKRDIDLDPATIGEELQ